MGVGHVVHDNGVVLEHNQICRWQDGRILFDAPVDNQYGSCSVIHRADLHQALVDEVLRMANVELRLKATVVDIAFDDPAVTLWSGEVIYGDIVVAADGANSLIRSKMLPEISGKTKPTGDAAFRILIPRKSMIQDADLRELIDEPKTLRWLGPHRHIVGYPVRKHQLYNVVLVHPDSRGIGDSWTIPGSKQEMIDVYRGWEPRVQKLIRIASDTAVLKSRFCAQPPLNTWVKGQCTLVGDACHPMLCVLPPQIAIQSSQ
jgi:salicylate hydroxylase